MAPSSWSTSLQVDENNLQKYMCQKQHILTLQGAAVSLGHTLALMPTTNAADGLVHFGDSLMLRSACTHGLLNADAVAQVSVNSGLRSSASGLVVSTSATLSSCPRNVFTVSRVDDKDGFGDQTYVHYGQVIRLGTGAGLHDQPYYVWASASEGNEEQGGGSTGSARGVAEVCVYPRAASGSYWRVLRAETPPRRKVRPRAGTNHSSSSSAASADDNDAASNEPRVSLGDAVRLESVAGGCDLQSDPTVIMTSYGNEWRVFAFKGALSLNTVPGTDEHRPEAGATNEWSFTNSDWADGIMEDVRKKAAARATVPPDDVADVSGDPAMHLIDPVYRAQQGLRDLEAEGLGARRYLVIARVYPLLKGTGMHVVRKLRRMCRSTDVEGKGQLPLRTFQGLLSWVAVRLSEQELQQMKELFGVDAAGTQWRPGFYSTPQEEDSMVRIDYQRFFQLMGPAGMSTLRLETVRDAYTMLQDKALGRIVEVSHIRRLYRPESHPEVQTGSITEVEAQEDFLLQWDVESADGSISWNEFLDYYRDVSLATETDDIFVELVRSAWGL
ncbi:unnamed protein product [Polarella glacialis]|uniref:EF-hand domain-containing protein n=1 Tax=Polarella glacialis TaxID=89957 RepID=A0A813F7A6_POLGL|nr:unnamed protein product [Polarella glacialis]